MREGEDGRNPPDRRYRRVRGCRARRQSCNTSVAIGDADDLGSNLHDSNGIIVEDGGDVLGGELVGGVGNQQAGLADGTVTNDDTPGLHKARSAGVTGIEKGWRAYLIVATTIVLRESRFPMLAAGGAAGYALNEGKLLIAQRGLAIW